MWRFYEELDENRQSKGTVVAVDKSTERFDRYVGYNVFDAVAGVFDKPNSPVGSDSVSIVYLHTRTQAISETRARWIHPALFTFLDQE